MHSGKKHIPVKLMSFGIHQFATDGPQANFLVYVLISDNITDDIEDDYNDDDVSNIGDNGNNDYNDLWQW